MWTYVMIACVIAVVLYFVFKGKYQTQPAKEPLIIYGANFCGWCKKQKEELDANSVPYKYVDCQLETEICNTLGITSYPTLFINGVESKGFQKAEDIIKKLATSST